MINSWWHVSLHRLSRLYSQFALLIKDLYDFGGAVCIRRDDILDVSLLLFKSLSQWGSDSSLSLLQIYCKNDAV